MGWFSFDSTFLHLATNVPVLEDTLMRVLVIGLSRELPLGQVDAVELADQLVKRAASLCLDGKGHFHQAMSISQFTNVNKILSQADNIRVLQNPISSSSRIHVHVH